MDETLQVRIMTPHQMIFQGRALAVSSINSEGKFDILPEHANFITLIENQTIQVTKDNREPLSFNFHQAIIYNEANQVSIYAEPLSL